MPHKLERYLERLNLPYDLIEHPPSDTLEAAAEAVGIPLSQLARAVILTDHRGLVMAVLPGDHLLDFKALERVLKRKLRPATAQEIGHHLKGAEPGLVPPLSEPFGLDAMVDERLAAQDWIYFESGGRNELARLVGEDFQLAHATSRWGLISRPLETLARETEFEFTLPDGVDHHGLADLLPAEHMEAEVSQLDRLPAMPEMAHQLLRLRNDPHATIETLAEAVRTDPSLTAQVIRYAKSAYFGYRGKIESIEQAITRVLGFDTVINMALGIATGQSFRIAKEGPLGLHAFWRHAIYSAALTQALANLLPKALGVKPGMAYLAGLLHNLGHLLLGELFKSEFYLLNRTVELNPDVPITLVERRLLGTDHTRLGARLMEAWDMPEELRVVVAEHHNESYRDAHAPYANLVMLADQLIRAYDLGDGATEDPPPVILTALGLEFEQVLRVTQRVMDGADGLNTMADQLAA